MPDAGMLSHTYLRHPAKILASLKYEDKICQELWDSLWVGCGQYANVSGKALHPCGDVSDCPSPTQHSLLGPRSGSGVLEGKCGPELWEAFSHIPSCNLFCRDREEALSNLDPHRLRTFFGLTDVGEEVAHHSGHVWLTVARGTGQISLRYS